MAFFKTSAIDRNFEIGDDPANPAYSIELTPLTTKKSLDLSRKAQKALVKQAKIKRRMRKGEIKEKEALAQLDEQEKDLIENVQAVAPAIDLEWIDEFEKSGFTFFGEMGVFEAMTIQARGGNFSEEFKKKLKQKSKTS